VDSEERFEISAKGGEAKSISRENNENDMYMMGWDHINRFNPTTC
jgi:hypothetical protein